MVYIAMPRAGMIGLVMLPVLLGSAGATNVSHMSTNGTTTEIAAKPIQAPSDSGITGQVSIRPVRPHATVGAPNVTPYHAKIEVLDSNGHPVTSVETDPSGNFRIALPPGKYVLRPQSTGPYPRASEQTVVVSPKSFAQVRVVYDSGIR
jgi:hypothetical protein